MDKENKRLHNNEDKLDFIINYLKLNANEIAKLFGVQSNYISKLREYTYDFLKPMHLYAFQAAYNIPYKIFEDKNIKSSQQIIEILEKQKKAEEKTLFKINEQLLSNIQGEWYAYFYPSNRFADIYRIKTTINSDGTIIDENNNWGRLYI